MNANQHEEFSIEDLAQRSGLPLRTVRYYIQQGLLPGPDTAGKYASYSRRHLEHLEMVQRLKRLHLPLKEIQHLIANMSQADMRRMLHMQDQVALQNLSLHQEDHQVDGLSSAMDYIAGLAQRQARVKHIAESPSAYTQPAQGVPQPQPPERWSRIRLTEGIELSVREQESRALRDEINQLIAAANKIFGRRNA